MEKCIVTTSWDDGSSAEPRLASLMEKYGLRGTFYFSKLNISELHDDSIVTSIDSRFEIGAHSLTHPDLTQLKSEPLIAELKGSKQWLEGLLGHSVDMFAYPSGKCNSDIAYAVMLAGYFGARSLNFSISEPKERYMLGVSVQASNGSPLQRLRGYFQYRRNILSLLDWASCSKLLFDFVSESGGIWHLWGHSWEIAHNNDWKKIEDVFNYVANRNDVRYFCNGELAKMCPSSRFKPG